MKAISRANCSLGLCKEMARLNSPRVKNMILMEVLC